MGSFHQTVDSLLAARRAGISWFPALQALCLERASFENLRERPTMLALNDSRSNTTVGTQRRTVSSSR